ncbi:arabinogalactan endo-1,4-beta-galactosidase [Geodermatophilus africanus]|uniref:Arabinogalactan endo-beta-1,4-galactanase n=1 Tax=Geodermatophilus africanus TaxID=1137993 RepID=A0A1H3REX0_9ACTN|nr:arabinogalactan endo-1,4-beta-galactosidase [Geodermatophilus africanus]
MRRSRRLAVPLLAVLLVGAAVIGSGVVGTPGALRLRGADVSFTLQEEAAGTVLRDGGRTAPIESVLAAHGATHVRLRVWVDPAAGSSGDLATALALARRAQAVGLGVVLTLHYSDTWADNENQTPPAAWAGLDAAGLAAAVEEHTRAVVSAFADQGTPADVVSIGNEVDHGMLWPVGSVSGGDWSGFARLVRAGLRGLAEASGPPPSSMVHLAGGGDAVRAAAFADRLRDEGVLPDVWGLSYYPFWHGSLDDLGRTVSALAAASGTDVLVVETAHPWTLQDADGTGNIVATRDQLPDGDRFPPTPEGQVAWYEELRRVLTAVPDGRALGFMVWEPGWGSAVEAAPGAGNQHDNLTLFDRDGRGLPALAALRPPADAV